MTAARRRSLAPDSHLTEVPHILKSKMRNQEPLWGVSVENTSFQPSPIQTRSNDQSAQLDAVSSTFSGPYQRPVCAAWLSFEPGLGSRRPRRSWRRACHV